MEDEQPDEEFQHAVELFNQREFFACHDALEEIWSETIGVDREFLQGLIHAAVALFHFGEGNLGGARKMHDSAIRYLSSYGPAYHKLDLARFRCDFDFCFEPLLGSQNHYPANVQMDEQRIPLLHSEHA